MTDQMHKILESQRAMRKSLAALTFSEKGKILELLRDRTLAIQATTLARKNQPTFGARSLKKKI